MDDDERAFLDRLLETPSPAGFERDGQSVWAEYVAPAADDVTTDAYGTAVATVGGGDPSLALASHADEIGLVVRRVDDDGFVHPGGIGIVDPAVLAGQRVTIHADGGPVAGVVGETAIHLRDEEDPDRDVGAHRIDVGAADGDDARALVSVGDPITVAAGVTDLAGSRVAARGADNRVGAWAVAAALRRADAGATLHGVNTVQEETGGLGAKTAGFGLDPDAVVVVDVTFATDHPRAPADKGGDVALGDGPVVARGSVNHPDLVAHVREAAADAGIDVQVEATGTGTGTDAESFGVQRSGVPACYVGIPCRYMHTPGEVVDLADLDATADLLAAVAERAAHADLP